MDEKEARGGPFRNMFICTFFKDKLHLRQSCKNLIFQKYFRGGNSHIITQQQRRRTFQNKLSPWQKLFFFLPTPIPGKDASQRIFLSPKSNVKKLGALPFAQLNNGRFRHNILGHFWPLVVLHSCPLLWQNLPFSTSLSLFIFSPHLPFIIAIKMVDDLLYSDRGSL